MQHSGSGIKLVLACGRATPEPIPVVIADSRFLTACLMACSSAWLILFSRTRLSINSSMAAHRVFAFNSSGVGLRPNRSSKSMLICPPVFRLANMSWTSTLNLQPVPNVVTLLRGDSVRVIYETGFK